MSIPQPVRDHLWLLENREGRTAVSIARRDRVPLATVLDGLERAWLAETERADIPVVAVAGTGEKERDPHEGEPVLVPQFPITSFVPKSECAHEWITYDLQLVCWGDGSGLPTSGSGLAIVGLDNDGLLRIRTFGINSGFVVEADETKLPRTQGHAIDALKRRLPSLLPPRELAVDEKVRLIGEMTSILGQARAAKDNGIRIGSNGYCPICHRSGLDHLECMKRPVVDKGNKKYKGGGKKGKKLSRREARREKFFQGKEERKTA
jgi:hypothetical protein